MGKWVTGNKVLHGENKRDKLVASTTIHFLQNSGSLLSVLMRVETPEAGTPLLLLPLTAALHTLL